MNRSNFPIAYSNKILKSAVKKKPTTKKVVKKNENNRSNKK